MGVELTYLLAAAFMPAPGGLLMAKMIIPETGEPVDISSIDVNGGGSKPVNVVEAASRGAFDGIKLAALIAANLMAIISLVAMVNGMLGGIGGIVGFPELICSRPVWILPVLIPVIMPKVTITTRAIA